MKLERDRKICEGSSADETEAIERPVGATRPRRTLQRRKGNKTRVASKKKERSLEGVTRRREEVGRTNPPEGRRCCAS